MSEQPLAALRCQACGAPALERHGTTVNCGSCGAVARTEEGIPILVRSWSTVQADLEEARRIKPNWYETVQPPEQSSPWRHHLRKRREYVERAIARHLAAAGKKTAPRLLDLGCGDGNNLRWLAQFTDHAYGCDYNLVRLTRAQAQNPAATIFAADILDFPSEDAAFDVIFFNHVIEHIPDDVAALKVVKRILRPGGLLVLGTPNEGAWWWQWAYRRDPQTLATTDHVHFYTGDSIGAKVQQAGLALLTTHYLGWGPPDWRLDGRIRKYKILDDLFTAIGRVLLPRQASSLYLLATIR